MSLDQDLPLLPGGNSLRPQPPPLWRAPRRWSRRQWLLLTLALSLLLHILLVLGLLKLTVAHPPAPRMQKVPVRLEFREKKASPKPEKEDSRQPPLERQQIVEAPMPETAAPETKAYLGAQNHRAAREQKTQPRASAPAAPATALQNGRLHLERAVEDRGGTIKVPAKKAPSYAALLPEKFDVINPGHNDYLPDKNIPVGPVLDVNTTDYRFIAYFTAVRKQVDLAYYDVGPTLRDSPHVRGQMQNVGKVHFQGSSVVQLKVMRSGVLVESKLSQTSGDKQIDEFWLRVLNLAAPYPPLPREYPDEQLVFTYALYYDLVYQDAQRLKRLTF